MLARHHPLAQEVHERRAHLRRRINRARVCEGAHERIRLSPVAAGDRTVGCPGVEGRAAVSRQRQSIPNLSLPWRFARPRKYRLHQSKRLRRRVRSDGLRIATHFGCRRGRQGCDESRIFCRAIGNNRGRIVNHFRRVVHLRDGTDQEKRCNDHLPPQYARGSCKSVPTRNEANLLFKRSGGTGLSVSF